MDEDRYRPPASCEAPWLIVTHENHRKVLEKQTFYTMSSLSPKNKSYVKKIVELNGKFILGSNFGWLILRERETPTMYSLWNPVTLQSLFLPELLDAPEQWPTCVFTSPPDDDTSNSDCVLVLFFRGLMFFCKPTMGDDCRWVKQSLEYNGTSVLIIKVVTLNEDIYALAKVNFKDDNSCCEFMFARIKITDNVSNPFFFEPSLLELPCVSIEFGVYPQRHTYLVETCGILYYVHMMIRQQDNMDNYDIFMVFIWKLDLSQMKWIRVMSLGERAFLLGGSNSVWCWAGTSVQGAPIEGDCIYLAEEGCQTLHLYRLRDNSHTFLLPHPNFLWNLDGPIWFMPNHNRFTSHQNEKTQNVEMLKHVEDMEEEMDMEKSINVLCQLPSDIMISIANRMHLIDYMNLRSFFKTVDTIIPPPKRRDDCSFPSLMTLNNNKGVFELWDPFENISHTFKTPYSPDDLATIEFCKDGWLLLRIGKNSLQYFNPFTEERGEYPPCQSTDHNASYTLSTCPNSSDCLTAGMFGHNQVIISCFQAAKKEWDLCLAEHHPDEDIEFQANYNSSAKYYNGACYFIGVKGNLGVLKMVEGEWSWKVYRGPLTEEARSTLNSCYLVELDGQLASVFFQQVGRMVQVFKYEILENSWVELNDLGEYVLFLSPASSFSVVEKDSTKRNRIYLSKRMGNEIVYYSLDTLTYHALGKEDSMDDFYGMRTEQACCWI